MPRNTVISKLSREDIQKIQDVYDSEFIGVCTLSKRVGLHYKQLYKLRDLGLLRLYRTKSELSKFNISREHTARSIQAGLAKWNAAGGARGRSVSAEVREKIKRSVNKRIAEGTFVPPCMRYHSSLGLSYAERYFKEWLEKECIQFTAQYRVGRYVLDFLIGNIDLEIDGHWHKTQQNVIDKDIRRTHYLERNGFKVVRVDWSLYSKLDTGSRGLFLDELKNCLLDGLDTPIATPVVKKCPICGAVMTSKHTGVTCSAACGKKHFMMTIGTYNADKLMEGESVYECTFRLYNENGNNYERTGRVLGITGNAVKKRIRKYFSIMHQKDTGRPPLS